MITNFLDFCRTGSAIDVAFVVGVLGVDCVACVGKMYTWCKTREIPISVKRAKS